MKPFSCPLTTDSLIGSEHSEVDYQDAYAIQVPAHHAVPPEQLVQLFFHSIPVWAKVLLGIRETLAGLVGLKTANRSEVEAQIDAFTGQPGESIALFHVRDRTGTEILTGEKDKHLDFSLSFIGETKGEVFEVVLATTVIFNNWLGRLYFLPVGPIHRLLVPAMLKRIARKLVDSARDADLRETV